MSFERSLDRVLIHEGGYVNDPKDPGGETNFGISKRAFPDLDIRHLTRETAGAIYRRQYWAAVRGDDIHPAIAFQAFDAAVNHGVERSARWLQEAAGVAVDGKIGPITLAAIRSASPGEIVLRFNALRLRFYISLPTFERFGRGWSARLAENLAFAAADLAA